MKAILIKLTLFFSVLPFLNFNFNNFIRITPKSYSTANISSYTISPNKCSNHLHCSSIFSCKESMPIATPDFGKEMGKYVKANFIKTDHYKVKTLVIDAGHGGRDGGTVGKNAVEKDIALEIALKLGQKINSYYPDVNVIYTRDDDRFIPLNKRAKVANDHKADLFISIHCNYLEDGGKVRGSETYVMGLHTANENLRVAKRENASIYYEKNYEQTYGGYDPESPEGHIILSMYQNAYLDQSIVLADKIEGNIRSNTYRKSHGVKQAGFVVLKQTTMPSVLVETGYLSNANDEAFLLSTSGQASIATSILNAFGEYKNAMEENQQNVMAVPVANDLANHSSSIPKQTIKAVPVPEANIEFKVILQTANELLNVKTAPWNELNRTLQITQKGNIYKYQIAHLNSFDLALKVKQEMKNIGFIDAYIAAFKNGNRIDVKQAISDRP